MTLSWPHLVAEYPRFAQFVQPSGPALSGTEWIAPSVRAGAAQFDMPSEKLLAQLWWYSFCNATLSPGIFLMVEFGDIPAFDFATGTLFSSGFWGGYITDVSAQSVAESGAQCAASVMPLIDTLCAKFGVRQAPLWAITADCLRQSALEAGNNAFDPAAGVRVAQELVAGFAGAAPVSIPDMTCQGIIAGDFVTVSDEGEVAEDMYVVAPRASCCMVYRSPGSGLCTSCPKRSAAERQADLVALAHCL